MWYLSLSILSEWTTYVRSTLKSLPGQCVVNRYKRLVHTCDFCREIGNFLSIHCCSPLQFCCELQLEEFDYFHRDEQLTTARVKAFRDLLNRISNENAMEKAWREIVLKIAFWKRAPVSIALKESLTQLWAKNILKNISMMLSKVLKLVNQLLFYGILRTYLRL